LKIQFAWVLSLAKNRPGGNVTGILRYVDGLAGKDLELAAELIPSATRVGLLVNTTSAESTSQRRDVESAGRQLNIVVVPAEVREPDDLDTALKSLVGANVQALIVLQDSMFFSEHRRIATLAATERLPTVWTASLFVDDGGLISYGVDEVDSFRYAAVKGGQWTAAMPQDSYTDLEEKLARAQRERDEALGACLRNMSEH
jgi:putative ABC transport system substrate-binding protein